MKTTSNHYESRRWVRPKAFFPLLAIRVTARRDTGNRLMSLPDKFAAQAIDIAAGVQETNHV
jgi:hypothetical protein